LIDSITVGWMVKIVVCLVFSFVYVCVCHDS